MIKLFLIDIIKTLIVNTIGVCILYKSSCYVYEHNDISFLIGAILCILVAIGIYFIKKNFTAPTAEETSRSAIRLFLYAYLRKRGKIEKEDFYESTLNNSAFGEIIKEFIDKIE